MRCCHRPNSAVERSYEVAHGAAGLQGLTGDGANGREHVLYAMVELSKQQSLLFLCPLTLSDVDVDPNEPLGAPVITVGNETTRLDPPNLAMADNPILGAIFTASLTKCLVLDSHLPRKIFRIYAL